MYYLIENVKKNLELFPEPEIARGIMLNIMVKAIDLRNE